MSPTPIRDPNAPPDASELRDIPDHQHSPYQAENRDNPVFPGAPPSPDYPTGVPPVDPETPPTEPEVPPPLPDAEPIVGDIVQMKKVDADTASIKLSQADYSLFADGDTVVIDDTGSAVDGESVTLDNGNGTDTYECALAMQGTINNKGTITKGWPVSKEKKPAKKKK